MRLNIRRMIMATQGIPPYIKQCEYIENTNQAFINTEVQGGSNCAYEITFLMRNSQSVAYPQIITNEDQPSFPKICFVDDSIQIQYPTENISILEKKEQIISVVVNSNEYIVNGRTIAKEASISWGDYDVYLLSENPLCTPPATTLYCQARIYMCKMYTDDVLVRDFIPVYNTQTSEYGMWDKVNQEFYGSANGSKFTGVLLGVNS